MDLSLDGVDVEVMEEGDGPMVVLVHGSASDRRTWSSLSPALNDEFRVLSYSRRYHWPNPPAGDAADYTMTEHVDDLITVIGRLTPDPINLVGHSYGGFIALMLAERHPGMVRRLVLIEPPVVPLFLSDPPTPAELLKALVTKPRLGFGLLRFGVTGLGPARKAAKRGQMDKALVTLAKAILGRPTYKALSTERWEQAQANNIRAEYRSDIFDPITDDQVRNITAPTLLVSGADSVSVWPLLSDRLDELLPTSEHVRIPGASHIAHEDQPEIVAEHIRNFLTSGNQGSD